MEVWLNGHNPSRPVLTNPKHEAFAQAMANMDGTPACELYRQHVSSEGTVKTSQEGASRLLANRKVAARIEALKETVEQVANEKFALTRERWLAQFLTLAEKAQGAGDYAAAVRSLREIGLAMPGWYAGGKVEHSGSFTLGASTDARNAAREALGLPPMDSLTMLVEEIRSR